MLKIPSVSIVTCSSKVLAFLGLRTETWEIIMYYKNQSMFGDYFLKLCIDNCLNYVHFPHWRIMTEFPLTQCKISPLEKSNEISIDTMLTFSNEKLLQCRLVEEVQFYP